MEAAKIKVQSRLKPAKDIHIAFSNLLSCSDPDKFNELKQKLILSIDSAEVEYKILQDECGIMEFLANKWNDEIDKCSNQQAVLNDENDLLHHENDEIEQEREKVGQLNEMKSTIINEKVSSKIESIKKIHKDNEQKQKEIEEVRKTNKIRKYGKDLIEEGYQIFLLEKKPPFLEEEETNENKKDDEENGEQEDFEENEQMNDN